MNEEIIRRKHAIDNQKKKWMDKYGFYVEYVPAEMGLINCHTHGVAENFGHPDLQIVFPIAPDTAMQFFHIAVEFIKEGSVFEEGSKHYGFTDDDTMAMGFMNTTELGRPVVRLLIPDRNGLLPTEAGCDPVFASQVNLIGAE